MMSRGDKIGSIPSTWPVIPSFFSGEINGRRGRGGGGRVVNVASEMAYGLQADDLGYQRRRWSGPAAYAQSKQGNRMLSWVRAERLRDNRRMSMIYRTWDRFDDDRRAAILKQADTFLETLS